MPELTLREYQPGDEREILATFNRIFAAVDPGFVPRTEAFWRWQFLGNPSGSLILLAFTEQGRVAGQLANVLQRTWLDGELVNFSQAVDSMSDPALRQGLKRESLQARLGNAYADQYAGPEPGQHALLWGAPVPAAWRVGKTFIRYEVIRTQLALVCPPALVRARPAPGVEVAEVARFPLSIADLFERVAPEHRAIAVRDEPQLNWRFADHPEQDYRRVLATRGGAPAGYLVYRPGSFDTVDGRGLVCDWLVPAADEEVRASLLAWLAERGRADGVDELCAVFPDTKPEFVAFQRHGFRAVPTRYALVGRECRQGVDMRFVHEHWYYTLGDTDLV